jgi:hypothetical protein
MDCYEKSGFLVIRSGSVLLKGIKELPFDEKDVDTREKDGLPIANRASR